MDRIIGYDEAHRHEAEYVIKVALDYVGITQSHKFQIMSLTKKSFISYCNIIPF